MTARKLLREIEPLVRSKSLQAFIDYRSGDEEAALRHWKRTSDADDDRGLHALRSLAVHHHRQAYALELSGQSKEALRQWSKAVPLWSRVLETQTFRGLLPQFSTVATNMSLQPGELDAMIELLRESLLAPHLTLAVQAAERKQSAIAAGHVDVIRESGLPKPIVAAALARLTTLICRTTTEAITHTTFDDPTAETHEAMAAFVRKHLSEHVNGLLELVVLEVWRAQKAAEKNENIEAGMKRLGKKETTQLVNELANARDAQSDAALVHLVRTRLRELADSACRLKLVHLRTLSRKRSDLVDRINSALSGPYVSQFDGRRTLELALKDTQQMRDHADDGVALCDEWTSRFGAGTYHSYLHQNLGELREMLSRDLDALRGMRHRV